jgi:heptosyltransferase-2
MRGTVIVRLPNWLGDTVMAVPALRALRALHPEARLAAAGPWSSVLQGQGLADVLLEYPRAWSGRLRAADVARGLAPDMAVVFPGSLESALAARYWGARRRVGFEVGGRTWLLTDHRPLPDPRQHLIAVYLLLAEMLGAEPCDRVPRLAPPPPEAPLAVAARDLLATAGADRNRRPVIGVHLGAAYGPSKVWPAERTIEFCRRMARQGAAVVLLGAPADAGVADAIGAATGAPTLAGRDAPHTLPALLASLDALVCGDTGVAHLAAALGTPVAALFGPTDWRLSAPRGPVEILRHPTPCSPCFYRSCPIDHPCLRGITAAHVAAALAALGREVPATP